MTRRCHHTYGLLHVSNHSLTSAPLFLVCITRAVFCPFGSGLPAVCSAVCCLPCGFRRPPALGRPATTELEHYRAYTVDQVHFGAHRAGVDYCTRITTPPPRLYLPLQRLTNVYRKRARGPVHGCLRRHLHGPTIPPTRFPRWTYIHTTCLRR